MSAKNEMVEYCKALEKGRPPTDINTCNRCKRSSWTAGLGHYARCPVCYPNQPRPLAELLQDSSVWPGHQFVWANERGPMGRWVLLGDYFTVRAEDCRKLNDLLPDNSFGQELMVEVRNELLRMRNLVAELDSPHLGRAEGEAKRAMELADHCQRLEDALTRVRAEAHRLRDELEGRG